MNKYIICQWLKQYFTGKISYLIFYITNRCNLKCGACFYSEHLNKGINCVSIAEIEKISKALPYLLHLILTGGEPFLREDIEEIIKLFFVNSNTFNITIPTNGFFTDIIVSKTKRILETDNSLRLRINVSLDGPEEIHNRMRGHHSSFKNSINTIKQLQILEKHHENLTCGINTVLSDFNKEYLVDFIYFVRSFIKPSDFDIILARNNIKSQRTRNVTFEEYEFILRHLDNIIFAQPEVFSHKKLIRSLEKYTHKILLKTYAENKYQLPCLAGRKMLVIYENGIVMPCELIGKLEHHGGIPEEDFSFGNINDVNGDIYKLLKTKRAAEILKFIKDNKCYCSFECAATLNCFFGPEHFSRVFLNALFSTKL